MSLGSQALFTGLRTEVSTSSLNSCLLPDISLLCSSPRPFSRVAELPSDSALGTEEDPVKHWPGEFHSSRTWQGDLNKRVPLSQFRTLSAQLKTQAQEMKGLFVDWPWRKLALVQTSGSHLHSSYCAVPSCWQRSGQHSEIIPRKG